MSNKNNEHFDNLGLSLGFIHTMFMFVCYVINTTFLFNLTFDLVGMLTETRLILLHDLKIFFALCVYLKSRKCCFQNIELREDLQLNVLASFSMIIKLILQV